MAGPTLAAVFVVFLGLTFALQSPVFLLNPLRGEFTNVLAVTVVP